MIRWNLKSTLYYKVGSEPPDIDPRVNHRVYFVKLKYNTISCDTIRVEHSVSDPSSRSHTLNIITYTTIMFIIYKYLWVIRLRFVLVNIILILGQVGVKRSMVIHFRDEGNGHAVFIPAYKM